MIRRLAIVVAVAALLCGPPGCASGRGAPGSGGDTLELFISAEENRVVLYRVDDDGTLHFGGGLDAMNGNVTWSGPLTEGEREQLWAMVRDFGWLEKQPPEGDGDPLRKQRVTVRVDGTRRRFRVQGHCPDVAPVEALLANASLRRHDSFLDTLPRPDLERASGAPPPPATGIEEGD
jgi:hypothetical protein